MSTSSFQTPFGTVTILGPGLIGGSLALSLTDRNLAQKIILWDIDERNLADIRKRLSAIPFTTDLSEAIRSSDMVVFCIPVEFIPEVAEKILPHLKSPDTLVTDVGSVKGTVVRALDPLFAGKARFIGGHPMAGREKGGFASAHAQLFSGATVILTPTEQTAPSALAEAEAFWKALGMVVVHRTPEEHDRGVALISHLPHLLASLLVDIASRDKEHSIDLASSGFFKTTQLASANPELWQEILFSNPSGMQNALETLIQQLELMGARLLGEEWRKDLGSDKNSGTDINGLIQRTSVIDERKLPAEKRKATLLSLLKGAQHTHDQLLESRPSLKQRL